MPHIISTTQFSKEDVEKILARAVELEKQHKAGHLPRLLVDKIIACIFFEPSTRTRLSFETAALRLGANIISAENARDNSSSQKGETIEDTTKILSAYADAIVMRHPESGSAQKAVAVSTKPVINAGDGANEHPSQGLLDLYTIKKEHGHLDNLNIAFVGDLKNSRTMRSLLPLLVMYEGNSFNFISPKELVIGDEYRKMLTDKNIKFTESQNLDEALPVADVLYMTRVQKERFENIEDYNKVKDAFLLKMPHLDFLKQDSIIMHPLPRVNEIDHGIDNDSRAAYFRQAENGLYIRMSLLLYALEV